MYNTGKHRAVGAQGSTAFCWWRTTKGHPEPSVQIQEIPARVPRKGLCSLRGSVQGPEPGSAWMQ